MNSLEFDEEAEQRLDEERKQLCREKIEQSQAIDQFEAVWVFLFFFLNCFNLNVFFAFF